MSSRLSNFQRAVAHQVVVVGYMVERRYERIYKFDAYGDYRHFAELVDENERDRLVGECNRKEYIEQNHWDKIAHHSKHLVVEQVVVPFGGCGAHHTLQHRDNDFLHYEVCDNADYAYSSDYRQTLRGGDIFRADVVLVE